MYDLNYVLIYRGGKQSATKFTHEPSSPSATLRQGLARTTARCRFFFPKKPCATVKKEKKLQWAVAKLLLCVGMTTAGTTSISYIFMTCCIYTRSTASGGCGERQSTASGTWAPSTQTSTNSTKRLKKNNKKNPNPTFWDMSTFDPDEYEFYEKVKKNKMKKKS